MGQLDEPSRGVRCTYKETFGIQLVYKLGRFTSSTSPCSLQVMLVTSDLSGGPSGVILVIGV